MSMEINAVLEQMRAMRAQAGQDIAPLQTPVEGQLNFSTVLNESLQSVSESQALSRDMSLRYVGSKDDTQVVNRFVSLCKKNGPTIVGLKSDGMVKFFTYDLHGDIHWRAPMRELIDELEKSWPGKLRFHLPFQGGYVANPLKP